MDLGSLHMRLRCLKKLGFFAFNPAEGKRITKDGSDPKWILLSRTWFILNVKVQGYKNKWWGWGICELWSIEISPSLEDVLRYLCKFFVIVEIKEVTEAVRHCTHSCVKNQKDSTGPRGPWRGEKGNVAWADVSLTWYLALKLLLYWTASWVDQLGEWHELVR